jgi:hypothetical protein
VTVRLPDELGKRIEVHAQRNRQSRSEAMREFWKLAQKTGDARGCYVTRWVARAS